EVVKLILMSSYSYVAVDAEGRETRGLLEVPDKSEALRRIKEMGFFPTKVLVERERKTGAKAARPRQKASLKTINISIPGLSGRVKPGTLAIFTRQLATLVEAGMPLLRSLRTLQEQESNAVMREVIGELALSIEGGSSFAEA